MASFSSRNLACSRHCLPIFQRRSSAFVTNRSPESLQRGFDRLRSLQSRLRWPRLTHFSAFGREYELPLSKEEPRTRPVAGDTLQYLSGFFDGDGCVSPRSDLRSCSLSVGQVAANAEILLRFREAFGGAICRQTDGRGLQQPVVRWRVYGSEGKQAASILAGASIVKREKLLIASNWPLCRTMVPGNVKPSALCDVQCSWAYVAGFFDAEGCISVLPAKAAARLALKQVTSDVLYAVCNKLQNVCRSVLSVRNFSDKYFVLQVNTQEDVVAVLHHILIAGLSLKRQQAEAVLTLEPSSHMQIRELLTGLKGNQSRYSRLDTNGCARARAIAKIHAKVSQLESRGKVEAAAPVQELLAQMRQEHGLLNLRTAYCTLRADIRAGLAEGAQITSSAER
ncbi:unnamed protein product [Effrenium voratum]|nr:unnamed protein product [Effrenium voratum]